MNEGFNVNYDIYLRPFTGNFLGETNCLSIMDNAVASDSTNRSALDCKKEVSENREMHV